MHPDQEYTHIYACLASIRDILMLMPTGVMNMFHSAKAALAS